MTTDPKTESLIAELESLVNVYGGPVERWADYAAGTMTAAAATLRTQEAEIERLREALEQIRDVGTRSETVRIGDAYSEDGWQDNTIVSDEAEIADQALHPSLTKEPR